MLGDRGVLTRRFLRNQSVLCPAGSALSRSASLPAGGGRRPPAPDGSRVQFQAVRSLQMSHAYFSGPRRVARWVRRTGTSWLGDHRSRIEMLYGRTWNGVRRVDSAPSPLLLLSIIYPTPSAACRRTDRLNIRRRSGSTTPRACPEL